MDSRHGHVAGSSEDDCYMIFRVNPYTVITRCNHPIHRCAQQNLERLLHIQTEETGTGNIGYVSHSYSPKAFRFLDFNGNRYSTYNGSTASFATLFDAADEKVSSTSMFPESCLRLASTIATRKRCIKIKQAPVIFTGTCFCLVPKAGFEPARP